MTAYCCQRSEVPSLTVTCSSLYMATLADGCLRNVARMAEASRCYMQTDHLCDVVLPVRVTGEQQREVGARQQLSSLVTSRDCTFFFSSRNGSMGRFGSFAARTTLWR